jgi:hypothetical protein
MDHDFVAAFSELANGIIILRQAQWARHRAYVSCYVCY